ncbi:MAG: tetratricopeptide repeat protein, partial [Syntrophales bacterium]|nr:tetratricopeptide repeat protein [Syntrophales bacterium]
MKIRFISAIIISFILLVSLAIIPHKLFAADDTAANSDEAFAFAEALFGEGDYFRAITEYKRVVFHFPEEMISEKCHFRIGECYYRAKRWNEAVEALQAFIVKYPQSSLKTQALYMKGMAEKEMKRFREALDTFRELQDDKASSLADKAAYQKVLILIEREEWSKAISILRVIPQESPVYPNASKMAAGLERVDSLPHKSPATAGILA